MSDALSALMRDALVDHIEGARLGDEDVIELGFADLKLRCRVAHAEGRLATLQLMWWGPPTKDVSMFDAWAGMGESVQHAVLSGVHSWVEHPFEAIKAAFDGGTPNGTVTLAGATFAVFEDPGQVRGGEAAHELIERLRDQPPFARLVASRTLPILTPDRAHAVTCYAAKFDDGDSREVRVDGSLWPAGEAFIEAFSWPDSRFLSIRHTAVLVPEPNAQVRLERDAVLATLDGLRQQDADRHGFGADSHGYVLAAPLVDAALDAIEARGVELPEDFLGFVREVGGFGAGPYHGLLPPIGDAQLAHIDEPFPHTEAWLPGDAERSERDEDVVGTLPLAHMGCSYFSLLVVTGPARGQVWADVRAGGGGLQPTHASFSDWYIDWIEHAMRGEHPMPPGVRGACAFPAAMSKYFEAVEAKHGDLDAEQAVADLADAAIGVTSDSSNRYFDEGDPVSLCPWCASLAHELKVREACLVPGKPPKGARG